ncbi:MAG: VTT domain-containing protein [Georgenia sp.]
MVVFLPVEVYLVGAAVTADVAAIPVALVAAVAQVTGKMPFYLVGRGVLDLAHVRRRGAATGTWARRMTAVEEWARSHPWGPSAVTAVAAFGSVPPYAVVSVLAGTVGMRWWLFALVSLVGRFLRFWALMSIPVLLPPGLFGI